MSEHSLKLELITKYWEEVGIISVVDANGGRHTGRPMGFFNGFFILATIRGGRVWINVENIITVEEMGILITPEGEKKDEVSSFD